MSYNHNLKQFPHTMNEIKRLRKNALLRLIEYAGGRVHLAKMLGRSISTVNSWCDRGLISVSGADEVCNHPSLNKKFQFSDLRPDLVRGSDEA